MVEIKGWKRYKIGDCLEFKNGLNKSKSFFGAGTPIINYMDVFTNRGLHKNLIRGKVTLSSDEIRRYNAAVGDVLFTRTSETANEIGYASVLLEDIDDCVFSGFVLRGRPKNELLVKEYSQFCFITQSIRKSIVSNCTYTTRALINGKMLSAVDIIIPPKHEQEAIATALSDVDEYIESLEKLIAKKKVIKVGAMQELLTGKRRLPGFDKGWIKKGIKSICHIETGDALVSQKHTDGKIEVWDGGTEPSGYYDKANRQFSTITVARAGSAGYISFHKKPIWSGDKNISIFSKPGLDVNLSYIYYYLLLRQCEFKMASMGSSVPTITKSWIESYNIELPQKEEQQVIARIFSDLDVEIDALNSKLTKVRDIKIGMMQQLLTGQIRLVDVVECEEDSKLADAIVLAGIVDIWGQEPTYPLGRVKVAKLFYLYTRKIGDDISRFKELAAGPYDPTIRHGGGEQLAIERGFITIEDRGESSKFSCGENITEAVELLNQDQDVYDALVWLEQNFITAGRDELELLATVDCARVRIEKNGGTATPQSIKTYIENSPEWKAKLAKDYFHMAYITEALKQSHALFG